jgi:UrcA family protein
MRPNLKTVSRSALAFSIATLLTAVPAYLLVAPKAIASDQGRSETVEFADLDTATPSGTQALYVRIHAAAQRVCDERDSQIARACTEIAEHRAIEQLSLPLLATYESRTRLQRSPLADSR